MKKVLALFSVGLIVVSMFSMFSAVRAQSDSLPRIGNWRPGDAHVHSVHSHCPVWDINPIGTTANDAANSDLDWIIFADHSYDMDATEWQQAQEECKQAEASTGIKVMCGEELSVDEGINNAGHYLSYGLNNFIGNSGSYPDTPWWPHEPDAQAGINLVNSQEGVGFIAHPYNSFFELVGEWDWDSWGVASGYTGIEVWNGGMSKESPDDDAMAKWNSLLVDGLTSGRHVVGIGNSDAHPRDPPLVDPDTYEPSGL